MLCKIYRKFIFANLFFAVFERTFMDDLKLNLFILAFDSQDRYLFVLNCLSFYYFLCFAVSKQVHVTECLTLQRVL